MVHLSLMFYFAVLMFSGFYIKYSGVENKDKLIIYQTFSIFYTADFIGRVRVLHYSTDTLMIIDDDSTLRKAYCVLLQPIDSSGSVIYLPMVSLESKSYNNKDETAKSHQCFKKYEDWSFCAGPPVGDTIYLVFSERYYELSLFGKEVDGYIRFWSPRFADSKVFTYTRPAVAINSHLKRAKYRPYEGDNRKRIDVTETNRFVSAQDGFQLPKDSLFTYGKKHKKYKK